MYLCARCNAYGLYVLKACPLEKSTPKAIRRRPCMQIAICTSDEAETSSQFSMPLLFSSTASLTPSSHQMWILASGVNSGWKLVPNTFPWRTATISPASASLVVLSFPLPVSHSPPLSIAWSLRRIPNRAFGLGKVAMISTGLFTSLDTALLFTETARDGAITVSSCKASSSCSPGRTGRIFSTMGARINIPLNGEDEGDGRNGR